MRIFCLARVIRKPSNNDTEDVIDYKTKYFGSRVRADYVTSRKNLLKRTLKNASEFGLSEIQIGKIGKLFYFIMYWENVQIIKIPLPQNKLEIIKKEKLGSNYAIDIEFLTSFIVYISARVEIIQIRAIKNTANTDITPDEIKLYNDYAKQINDFVKGNPDLYPKAFTQIKLNLSNLCKPKSLSTKVTDFCNAINDQSFKGDLKNIKTGPISDRAFWDGPQNQDPRKIVRYNQSLDEEVEICYDTNESYDARTEHTKDFCKCQKLSYDTIKISEINERWFLANGMIALKFSFIEIFQKPETLEIFAKNVGKLQHLFILEISHCEIKVFPDYVIQNLPTSLGSLILSGNDLTSLSEKICVIEKLQNLDLSINISLSEAGIPWNHLPISLEAFNLNTTSVAKIPEDAKQRLTNLTNIELQLYNDSTLREMVNALSEMSLTTYKSSLHKDKKYNETFDLAESEVTKIDNLEIPQNTSVIELSFNNLQTFDLKQTFHDLYILNLSYNKLTSMNFEILPSTLEEIHLSHNLLNTLGSCGHLKRLEKLYLQDNQLQALPSDLGQLEQLTVLNISKNYINELPQNCENLPISELDISENKFSAAHGNLKDVLWERLPQFKVLTLNGNAIEELPCELSNIPFTDLFAINCDLRYICPQIYKKLTGERYFNLNISENPSLKNLSFIPKKFYQPITIPEERSLVQKFNQSLKLDYLNEEGIIERTRLITNSVMLKNNQKTIKRVINRPAYVFRKTKFNYDVSCKCCAYCDYTDFENFEGKNLSVIEQTMAMDFKLIICKNDEVLPEMHGGDWQTNIKTRLCDECIQLLIEASDAAFEARRVALAVVAHNEKENKKKQPLTTTIGKRKTNTIDDEIVHETELYSNVCPDPPSTMRNMGIFENSVQFQASSRIQNRLYNTHPADLPTPIPPIETLYANHQLFQNNSSYIRYEEPFQRTIENADIRNENIFKDYYYKNNSALHYRDPQDCQQQKIILLDIDGSEVAQFEPSKHHYSKTIHPGDFEKSDEKIKSMNLTNEDQKMLDLSIKIMEQYERKKNIPTDVASKSNECEIIFENFLPTTVKNNNVEEKEKNDFVPYPIHGSDKIYGRLYNFCIPTKDNLQFFIPPRVNELQKYLQLLKLPLQCALKSPLLQSLSVALKSKRMITMQTVGDGNCGYRALSILLTGIEDYFWLIRIQIYQYIIANGKNIWGIGTQEQITIFKQKLERILQMPPQKVSQEFWCGNEDLYALADLLECNIYTYSPNPLQNYPNVTPHHKNNIENSEAPSLFLLWINNDHFEPIVGFV